MAVVEEIKVVIKAEVDAAIAKFMELDKTTQKTQSTFAKMRDVMQGPIAAFNTVLAVIGKVKAVSDKMENAWAAQEEALAILDSTLKATGATAWTSAEKLSKMASGFQSVTKYGDETVLAMQNVLLGFKNIKGDNFEDASLQILNMATVMKMDLTSAAQAVGKALDNPILGLDSLSRQGFKFTAQEKEMIKTLVEAGKLEDAQGIILKELATTYGGAAEAAGKAGTAIKVRLGNALGDLHEEIGRQITDDLAPLRLGWLKMIQVWAGAAKAQNDIRKASQDYAYVAQQQARISGELELDRITKTLKSERSKLEYMKNIGTASPGDYLKVSALEEDRQHLIDQMNEIDERINTLSKYSWFNPDSVDRLAEATADFTDNTTSAAGAVSDLAEAGGNLQLALFRPLITMQEELARQYDNQTDEIAEVNRLLIDEAEYQREVNRASAAYVIPIDEEAAEFIREANRALADYTVQSKELTETQKAQQGAVVSGYQAMAEALGASLITGEDGWKSFGRAGLNAIAGVIEAMAIESDALIAQATAQALLGDLTKIPGLGAAIAASVAAHSAAGLVRAIPMAEGGSGVVTRPTLFLAGEKGPEPYAFGGANNKLGMGMTQNIYIGGSVIRESEVGMIGAAQMAKAGRGY